MRLLVSSLVALALAISLTPPAAATHNFTNCVEGVSNSTATSSAVIDRFCIHSGPHHCSGTPGVNYSCTIVVEACSWHITGTLRTGTGTCTGVTPMTCTTGLGNSCGNSGTGSGTVLEGVFGTNLNCMDFTATVTSSIGGLDAVTKSYGWRVCVDHTGPYVP